MVVPVLTANYLAFIKLASIRIRPRANASAPRPVAMRHSPPTPLNVDADPDRPERIPRRCHEDWM
jgi:hypothetical protein